MTEPSIKINLGSSLVDDICIHNSALNLNVSSLFLENQGIIVCTLVTRPPFLCRRGSLNVTLLCLERQGVLGQVEEVLVLLPGESRHDVSGGV